MKVIPATNRRYLIPLYMLLIVFSVSFIVIPTAFSHGGKVHAENEFTAFDALQKATKLYGQLLTKGKLSEAWEFDLVNIFLSTRVGQNGNEFVVLFQIASGEQNKVFIFFDATGKYLGSNFTGK